MGDSREPVFAPARGRRLPRWILVVR